MGTGIAEKHTLGGIGVLVPASEILDMRVFYETMGHPSRGANSLGIASLPDRGTMPTPLRDPPKS